jgi:hypothetical protein
MQKNSLNKPFITGYYGCSCHPFNSWEECSKFHKQKFGFGEWVKHRCNGREGQIKSPTDEKGFVIVDFGGLQSDHHLEHSANLIKVNPAIVPNNK